MGPMKKQPRNMAKRGRKQTRVCLNRTKMKQPHTAVLKSKLNAGGVCVAWCELFMACTPSICNAHKLGNGLGQTDRCDSLLGNRDISSNQSEVLLAAAHLRACCPVPLPKWEQKTRLPHQHFRRHRWIWPGTCGRMSWWRIASDEFEPCFDYGVAE